MGSLHVSAMPFQSTRDSITQQLLSFDQQYRVSELFGFNLASKHTAMEKTPAWTTSQLHEATSQPPLYPSMQSHPSLQAPMPTQQTTYHTPPQPQMPTQRPFTSIPWLLISESDIRSTQTQMPIFRIEKSGAPGSVSKKSLLTVTRVDNGLPLGDIRFRSIESYIELSIRDQKVKIKEDGVISFRYYFHPSFPSKSKWWWKEEDDSGLKLTDGKKGATIASVNGNVLIVEPSARLSEVGIDEVVLSAVAMVEKKRRRKKSEGFGEVLEEIIGL